MKPLRVLTALFYLSIGSKFFKRVTTMETNILKWQLGKFKSISCERNFKPRPFQGWQGAPGQPAAAAAAGQPGWWEEWRVGGCFLCSHQSSKDGLILTRSSESAFHAAGETSHSRLLLQVSNLYQRQSLSISSHPSTTPYSLTVFLHFNASGMKAVRNQNYNLRGKKYKAKEVKICKVQSDLELMV